MFHGKMHAQFFLNVKMLCGKKIYNFNVVNKYDDG